MSKQGSNSRGFAALEAILILVIVAILGFTGWFVWHSKQNTDKTMTESTSTAQATKPSIVVPFNSQQAVNLVQKTYDTYLKTVNATNAQNTNHPNAKNQTLQAAGLASVKSYLDPGFYSLIAPAKAGHDSVGCALYSVDSYKASLTSSNASEATVAVAIYSGSNVNGIITVKVDLSTHKITDIVCPQ